MELEEQQQIARNWGGCGVLEDQDPEVVGLGLISWGKEQDGLACGATGKGCILQEEGVDGEQWEVLELFDPLSLDMCLSFKLGLNFAIFT